MTAKETFFLKLYDDPLIYVIASGLTAISGLKLCLADAGPRKLNVIVVPYWNVRNQLRDLTQFAGIAEALHNRMEIWFMCPSEADANLLKSNGARAIHAHQNAFIDENIFTPDPKLGKRFHAIHSAAMQPWKRHELAWGVERICVVTYRHDPSNSVQPIRGYRHLEYTNLKDDGSVEQLGNTSVSRLICESCCGLSLSAIEGANFASGEYQFCGIPVISTRSAGGRAEFFDGKSTVIIKPHPSVVEKAVDFVRRNPIDPAEIRSRVIQRAIRHRHRLLDWMSDVVGERLHSKADRFARLPQFKDKLREAVPSPD